MEGGNKGEGEQPKTFKKGWPSFLAFAKICRSLLKSPPPPLLAQKAELKLRKLT